MRYTSAEHDAFARDFNRDGLVVLKNHFPREKLEGDVMIRDVRAVHRGTPNTTDEPRPMVVLGYSRRWMFRPEVQIRVPQSVWDGLSPLGRSLLRFNPVVAGDEVQLAQETYTAFAY